MTANDPLPLTCPNCGAPLVLAQVRPGGGVFEFRRVCRTWWPGALADDPIGVCGIDPAPAYVRRAIALGVWDSVAAWRLRVMGEMA